MSQKFGKLKFDRPSKKKFRIVLTNKDVRENNLDAVISCHLSLQNDDFQALHAKYYALKVYENALVNPRVPVTKEVWIDIIDLVEFEEDWKPLAFAKKYFPTDICMSSGEFLFDGEICKSFISLDKIMREECCKVKNHLFFIIFFLFP